MDKPVFKLEVFEGPLDLLLKLISKHKINIYDIPIALVLDQYMESIEGMKRIDLDVASEFLTMAAYPAVHQVPDAAAQARGGGRGPAREPGPDAARVPEI